MDELDVEKPEAFYDKRWWWQYLEEEVYFRPLTYHELKGEFEKFCNDRVDLEVTPEIWDEQIESIRDSYSEEDDHFHGLELSKYEEYQKASSKIYDVFDLQEDRLGRKLTIVEATQEFEANLCRKLVDEELKEFVSVFNWRAECIVDFEVREKKHRKNVQTMIYAYQAVDPYNSIQERNAAIRDNINIFSLTTFLESYDSHNASMRTVKGHAKRKPSMIFVQTEWAKHREAYSGNKSAFARAYSRLLSIDHGVTVTEKQIRDVWLTNNPVESSPDCL